MPIKNRFAELHAEITAWRRDLHENPELGFELPRTSAFVAERLKEFGCDEVVTGVGSSGVVGLIRGRSDTKGRVIGLRADMDALPILEATGLEYASKTPGKMHACGHDGHTAMVLGAAKYLAETRNFDGTVAVVFQPAEEGGGGAKVMMDDGLLDRFGITEIYGMHNVPGMAEGTFAIRPGPFYACADQFDISIRGKTGHAAQPHNSVDAIVVASHVVLALQTIRSRLVDPVQELVVSVTSMHSDTTAHNVIAGEVKMRGTVRCFDRDVRAQVKALLPQICEGAAAALGAEAVVAYEDGYPMVVNHDEPTEFAAGIAERVSGGCGEAPLIMWGEDFAYFLEDRPGAYIWMGIGEGAGLHNAGYNFNDEVLPVGCSWFAEIAEQRMPLSIS